MKDSERVEVTELLRVGQTCAEELRETLIAARMRLQTEEQRRVNRSAVRILTQDIARFKKIILVVK